MQNFAKICFLFMLFAFLSCKSDVPSSIFQASSGEKSDAFLKNLIVEADGNPVPLSSPFSSNLYRYEVTVPYKTQNVKLQAIANSTSASVKTDPQDVDNVDIKKVAGASCVCVITVTSANKEVKHKYFVQLNRAIASKDRRVASLVLSSDNGKVIPLNEAFYSGRFEYTADISEDFNGSLKLKAFPYSAFATSNEVKKEASEAITKLEVEVKAEDDNIPSQKYSVSVSKVKKFSNEQATDLSIVYISYKGKYAKYDGTINSYILNVPIQDSENDIKNALEIKTYAEYYLDDFDSSQTLGTIDGAEKLYLINVHNKEGKNRNYKLVLVRGDAFVEGKSDNADLAKIEFITDNSKINPIDCIKNRSDVYNVPVNKRINTVQVVAVAADDKATISISPQTPTNINIDENKDFVIIVRAENGMEKKYVVKLQKSLSVFVRVLSEKRIIPQKDLAYLTDKQKLNEMFTGAFYSSEKEVLPYEIGMYEVNYKLWYEVRKWAELQGYCFNNKGCEGENVGELVNNKIYANEGLSPTPEKQYNPVTAVSYRDAIVWCNAYSEMHDLQPVYYFDGKILRDATLFKRKKVETTNNQFIIYDYYYADMATKDTQANGYRLPTTFEWEIAARGGDVEKEEWDYAFPGVKGFENGKSLIDNQKYAWGFLSDYAWNFNNAKNKTHDVGEKRPNSLGIYDMAGNVYEICEEVKKFENPKDSLDPKYNTFIKGGSYKVSGLFPFTSSYFQDVYYTETKANDFGFRLAKTIK